MNGYLNISRNIQNLSIFFINCKKTMAIIVYRRPGRERVCLMFEEKKKVNSNTNNFISLLNQNYLPPLGVLMSDLRTTDLNILFLEMISF